MMEIKRPMELAGLKSRLQRAQRTEQSIAITGRRYDAVLDKIDELHSVSKSNVGQLETYAGDLESTIGRMIGGSNAPPNDDGQDGQGSSAGQTIADEKVEVVAVEKLAVEEGQTADTTQPPATLWTDPEPNKADVLPEVKP